MESLNNLNVRSALVAGCLAFLGAPAPAAALPSLSEMFPDSALVLGASDRSAAIGSGSPGIPGPDEAFHRLERFQSRFVQGRSIGFEEEFSQRWALEGDAYTWELPPILGFKSWQFEVGAAYRFGADDKCPRPMSLQTAMFLKRMNPTTPYVAFSFGFNTRLWGED